MLEGPEGQKELKEPGGRRAEGGRAAPPLPPRDLPRRAKPGGWVGSCATTPSPPTNSPGFVFYVFTSGTGWIELVLGAETTLSLPPTPPGFVFYVFISGTGGIEPVLGAETTLSLPRTPQVLFFTCSYPAQAGLHLFWGPQPSPTPLRHNWCWFRVFVSSTGWIEPVLGAEPTIPLPRTPQVLVLRVHIQHRPD